MKLFQFGVRAQHHWPVVLLLKTAFSELYFVEVLHEVGSTSLLLPFPTNISKFSEAGSSLLQMDFFFVFDHCPVIWSYIIGSTLVNLLSESQYFALPVSILGKEMEEFGTSGQTVKIGQMLSKYTASSTPENKDQVLCCFIVPSTRF